MGNYLGTIIAFGGTMSGFLHTNEYVMESVECYERLSEQRALCRYKEHCVELIGTSNGYRSIISVLQRPERYKRVIGLGFFGGIAPSVNVGDILIPTKTVPLPTVPFSEGFPDQQLAKKLVHRARKLGTTHTGLLATSPRVIRHLTKGVESLRKQGVIGIDMESSCFFYILNRNSTASGAVMICSDHIVQRPLPFLSPNEARNLPLDTEIATTAKKAVLLAMETLWETF